jgi:hypothetical protein
MVRYLNTRDITRNNTGGKDMLIIMTIAVLTQVGLQYYLDHGLVNSILGRKSFAPWFRYQLAQSMVTRVLWNILTSGGITFMFGAMSGLYGPIAVLTGFGIYELLGWGYLHPKWTRTYLVHENTKGIDKFINGKVKELIKEAEKAGHLLNPDEARESVKRKYATEIEKMKEEARKRSEETTQWLLNWELERTNTTAYTEKDWKHEHNNQMKLTEEMLSDK